MCKIFQQQQEVTHAAVDQAVHELHTMYASLIPSLYDVLSQLVGFNKTVFGKMFYYVTKATLPHTAMTAQ